MSNSPKDMLDLDQDLPSFERFPPNPNKDEKNHHHVHHKPLRAARYSRAVQWLKQGLPNETARPRRRY